MLGINKSSPYRKALLDLICSINHEIGLKEENQVLIVIKLDSEDKIIDFNEWVKSKIKNNKLFATEAELMRAVVQINKKYLDKI